MIAIDPFEIAPFEIAPFEIAPFEIAQFEIARSQLATIHGAQASDFGRCGPGSSWKWLGNVFTPACAAHDAAVRGNLAAGSSPVMAHARALPLLPAAIGSYVRERFGG